MSQIIAVGVGPSNAPFQFTTASGTSAQVILPASGVGLPIITLGGAFLNGKPFRIHLGGFVKSHGASQTMQVGVQAQVYSSSSFSGTSLGLNTASGTMTAGTNYPFYHRLDLIADSTSGIMTGTFGGADGVTPTRTAVTVVANLITGVSWGTSIVSSGNAANPLASAAAPALQFAPQIVNGVTDTATVFNITNFFAETD
jgi:hypothetical protein